MTPLQQPLASLARSSKRAALIAAMGALIVFVSLGIGSLVIISANKELDNKHRELSQQIADKENLKKDLDQKIEASRLALEQTEQALARQRQETTAARQQTATAQQQTAAAQSEIQDITDRLGADSSPQACQELQKEIAPLEQSSTLDLARKEFRAGLAVRNKDAALAEQHFQKAIEADPTYAAPYNALGRLKLKSGKTAEAVALYQQALQHSPTYAPAIYNLARAYEIRGERVKALEYAKALQRLRPDDLMTRALLERLDTEEWERERPSDRRGEGRRRR